MSHKTFLKPISEIMEKYLPLYPKTNCWKDTIQFLLKEDSEIIDELRRQHKIHSQFREPIILQKVEETSDEGNYYRFSHIGDGTHRLVAAYLNGAKDILVAEDFKSFLNQDYALATKIEVTPDKKLTDDEKWQIFDKVRSICISDKIWITSSTASGNNGVWTILWDEDDKNLIPSLNQEVLKRIELLFPNSSISVETYCDFFEDISDDF